MMLQEKMDQAIKLHHEARKAQAENYQKTHGTSHMETEKGDLIAMILSAFLMLLPAVLLLLLLTAGACLLLLP